MTPRAPGKAAAAISFVVVMMAGLVFLGAWAVSSPSGSSPDDDFHLASAWCISDGGRESCSLVKEDRGYDIYDIADFPVPCYTFEPLESGACSETVTPQWRVNDNLYPGLFYGFSARFAGDDPAQFHVRARVAVVVSVVAILAAAYLVALPWLRPAMLVSWAVVAAPGLASWVASNNPSSWAIAGLAAAWGPMITSYLARDRGRQLTAMAVWLVAVIMAAGARSDGGIYAALMALAGLGLFVVLPNREAGPPASLIERAKHAWPGIAGSAVVLTVVALLVAGTEQAGMAVGGFWENGAQRQPVAVLWSIVLGFPGLLAGVWGAPGGVYNEVPAVFGWFDAPMPTGAWIPALLAVGGLVLAGVGIFYARKALAVAALLAVIVVVPTRSLLNDGAIVGELFQARYLAPLVTVLVGVLLLPSATKRVRLNGPQSVTLGLALAMAGVLGLHAWMRRFVTGVDVLSFDLTRSAEWWEFTQATPNQVWIMGSVAWLVVVVAAVSSLFQRRTAATSQPDPAQLMS